MITSLTDSIQSSSAMDPELEAMLEAGVHWGHARSKRHPGMSPYLWGVRNNVEIIDLVKTKEKLAEALAFVERAAKEKKLFLLVGTRPSAKDIIEKTAQSLDLPYVRERWLGGTLTNFKVILKRIETLESLEHEKASGGFEKYTKKERMKKEEAMERLREHFDSLRQLRKLPDVVIIADISHDALALREAKRMNIPVVALTDTNTNPRSVDYPIPANDDARPALRYMFERIGQAIAAGRQAAETAAGIAESVSNSTNAPVSPQ